VEKLNFFLVWVGNCPLLDCFENSVVGTFEGLAVERVVGAWGLGNETDFGECLVLGFVLAEGIHFREFVDFILINFGVGFDFEVFDNKESTVHKEIHLVDSSVDIYNGVCLFKGFEGEVNDELLFFEESKFLELAVKYLKVIIGLKVVGGFLNKPLHGGVDDLLDGALSQHHTLDKAVTGGHSLVPFIESKQDLSLAKYPELRQAVFAFLPRV
jgi:hypothetical protein